MASKRIQGITIEIGGDTTKLAASLKGVDSSISATKRALSDVDKLLKLDPTNTELLAQKQKLLGDAVTQTKERLAKLREASEQAAKTKDNYDAWKAKITPLWQEIEKTSNHLKELKRQQEEMKDAGEVDSDAYQALQKEIAETSARLKTLRADAKAVTAEFGNPISPEKFDALQREIIETENDLKGFESKAKDSGNATKKLGEQSAEAGNGLKVLGDVAKAAGAAVAAALAASTAAVVAFSKSAVSVGMTFDKSMSQVAATMGKTVDEITDLRDFAQEMGAKTAFSATQAADALNYMALAGYSAETSMKVLPSVLNLAAAGSMELASASDMITDSLSALGRDSSYATTLVDQMAAASSKANASVTQMGSAILTVGGTAKVLKNGTTELNAVLGLLADNGVKGAEGGTALRNVILSLTAPTDKAAATLRELGVKALDSSGNLRSMQDIFTDLDRALSGMSEGKKTEILNEIFNKTDLKSVNALLATGVDRWNELSGAIEHSRYAAEKMADTQLDNLAGDITLFQSALEGAQIVVSDGLMPQLRDLVQFGTEGITRVTDAFKNAEVAKSLAAGFKDAEGVMKPIEENADAIRDKLSAFRELAPLFSFRDEAGELGKVSELADGLYQTLSQLTAEQQTKLAQAWGLDDVDALYEILDPANELQWKLEKMVETADSAMQRDINLAKALLNTDDLAEANALLDESGARYDELRERLAQTDVSAMTDGFSAAMEELQGLVNEAISKTAEYLPEAFDTGAQILGAVLDGIIDNLPELTIGAAKIVDTLGHELGERIPALSFVFDNLSATVSATTAAFAAFKTATAISSALETLKKATESQTIAQIALNAVMNANPFVLIATVIAGVVAALITLWHTNDDFRNAVINAWNAVKTNALELKNNVVGKFQEMGAFISGLPAKAYKWGADLMENFKKGILNNPIVGAISGVANTIAAFLHHSTPDVGPLKNDDTWMPDMMRTFSKGIEENTYLVGNAARNAAFSVSEGLRPARDWAGEIGRYVSVDLADGIEKTSSKAQQAAEKMASNVYNGLSKWAERTTKYETLSLAEQLEIWREIQRRFEEGSDEWWSARDKVSDLESKLASEQAQTIRNTYNGLIQSVEYFTKRYGWSTRTQLSQYEEIRAQFERNSEEWLAADEKIFDTRQKLMSEQASAWKNYAGDLRKVTDSVTSLEESYQKDVEKRAGEIANSYKLFAEVPAAETISGKDLLNNLRAQIDSVRGFYDNLEKLSQRGVGAALVDEIRSMGVSASGELEALLKLSDKNLERYAEMYGEKQELANNIAVRELSGLREETDAKIRESLDSIEGLYDEYAPVIGRSLPEGLAEGIRNGMQEALDAADELANALQLKLTDMGGGIGLQNLLGAAADNTRILALEPASQRRESSGVREESYGYDNRSANAALRSAPVYFNMNNYLTGRRVESVQYELRDDETARRGPRLVKV